eukprot:77184_1
MATCSQWINGISVDKRRVIMKMTSQLHDVIRQLHRHPKTAQNEEILEKVLKCHLKYVTFLECMSQVNNTQINLETNHDGSDASIGSDNGSKTTASEDDIGAVATNHNTMDIHDENTATLIHNDESNALREIDNIHYSIIKSQTKIRNRQEDVHFASSGTGTSYGHTSDTDIPGNEEASVSFESEQNTNSHMRTISSDRAIISDDDYSHRNTQSREDDAQMNETVSQESQYYCEECDKHFKRKWVHARHIEQVHQRKKNYECKRCHKQFYSKQEYTRHFERMHEGKINHTCKECNATFYAKHDYIRHVERVHENKFYYGCNECHKTFYYEREYTDHFQRVHERERNVKCQHCKSAFYSNSGRLRHIRTVHEVNKCQKRSKRKYKCKKCNGSFYSKDGLSNHIKQMHNEEQKQWTCRYCDMVFSRKKDLKKHKLVHNTHKPYSCYICKKRFKTLSSRNKHKKTCSK